MAEQQWIAYALHWKALLDRAHRRQDDTNGSDYLPASPKANHSMSRVLIELIDFQAPAAAFVFVLDAVDLMPHLIRLSDERGLVGRFDN
jgi:hypothetical protein